jgi:hypothetical protein
VSDVRSSVRRRSKRKPAQSWQAFGLLGVMASGLLGFLPQIQLGNQDTTYDAYRIPQRCDVPQVPPREE